MISLQIAFLIAGVVIFIVVAVISYDKVRQSRLYNRSDSRLVDDIDDTEPEPLLGGGDSPRAGPLYQTEASPAGARGAGEPQLKPEFLEQDNDPGGGNGDLESRLKDAEELAEMPIGGVPEMQEPAEEDGMLIEYVARIPGKNVINRDTALGIYRQREFELAKPHRIFGLSHPARMWCDLEKQPESARFTDFGLTLQLADRNGPVDESEINQFSQLVLKLSEVFGRRFQFSCDFDDALKQAEYLHKLIKKYDALAILNIVARNDPFPMKDVDQAARSLEMTPNQKNVYVKHESQHAVYRMADREKARDESSAGGGERSTRGLTLFMDIPRTRDPARVFNDMVDDAKELCRRLDGKLVDENRRGMTQKGLKRIGQEIRAMATEMERDGIPPGGDYALKLF